MRAIHPPTVWRPPSSRSWRGANRKRSAAALLVIGGLLLFALYARPAAVLAGTPRLLADLPRSGSVDVAVHDLHVTHEAGFLTITGEARNLGARDLPQLEAIVEVYDDSGKLIQVESGLLKSASIPTGDQAPFEVLTKDVPSIASYRLRFRHLAGPTVPSTIEE